MLTSLIESLKNPEHYPHRVTEEIRVIETQVSWVILTGDFAYKFKKNINFGFLDFSTLKKRQFYCEEELRLNQRLAPDIYQAVVAICVNDDNPEQISISAEDYRNQPPTAHVIEYAVRMQQFDPDAGLDYLLEQGQFKDVWIEQLAEQLAGFHQTLPTVAAKSPWGKADNVWQLVSDNYLHTLEFCTDEQELSLLTELYTKTTEYYNALLPIFDERRKLGFIRECHGDLHLGNVTLYQDKIRLFDCIEFNLQFRWIDTCSDLAFLLMDLEANNKAAWANRTLNHYLELSGDYQSLHLLNFYKSFRAMVRAKVATLGEQANHQVFNHYLRLTQSYQERSQPKIYLMHGLSGSGKSYLSHKMLETINAIRIRSETERQRIFKDLQKKGKKLKLHSPEVNARLSQHLLKLTQQIVQLGYTIIIDGTFLKPHFRHKYVEIAEKYQSNLQIVSCVCDEKLMEARLKRANNTRRSNSGSPVERLNEQFQYQQPLIDGELKYQRLVNTDNDSSIKEFLDSIS